MTRHETISAAALRPARAGTGRHACRVAIDIGGGATLAAQLEDLAALGSVALLQVIRRFGLSPLDTDLLCLVAAPELGVDAAAALAAHPLALNGRATPALSVLVALGAEAGPALGPAALLRRAALVEALPGHGLAQRTLVLPEAVAAALIGARARPGAGPGADALRRGGASAGGDAGAGDASPAAIRRNRSCILSAPTRPRPAPWRRRRGAWPAHGRA